MQSVVLQNILLLMLLGMMAYSLSVVKRRLLRLSADLSERALRRRFIVSNPVRDFC